MAFKPSERAFFVAARLNLDEQCRDDSDLLFIRLPNHGFVDTMNMGFSKASDPSLPQDGTEDAPDDECIVLDGEDPFVRKIKLPPDRTEDPGPEAPDDDSNHNSEGGANHGNT